MTAYHHSLYIIFLTVWAFCSATVSATSARFGPLARRGGLSQYDNLKTNAERFKRGLGPKYPTRTYGRRVLRPRQSNIFPPPPPATVTYTGVIGVYDSAGAVQCYVGSTPNDCVAVTAAQTFTYTSNAGAVGPYPIQLSPAGTYLALEGLTANENACSGDLTFGTSTSDYGVGATPSGPNDEFETSVWTVTPGGATSAGLVAHNLITATWTNAAGASPCAGSVEVAFYLDTAPAPPRPGHQATPRTMLATASTSAQYIGGASAVNFFFDASIAA